MAVEKNIGGIIKRESTYGGDDDNDDDAFSFLLTIATTFKIIYYIEQGQMCSSIILNVRQCAKKLSILPKKQ